MAELSPELQETKAAFFAIYANGGIKACRTMVGDLQQEAEFVRAVSDGTDELDSETIGLQTVLTPEEVLQRLELTRGVTKDCIRATTIHSFAFFLLGIVEGPNE